MITAGTEKATTIPRTQNQISTSRSLPQHYRRDARLSVRPCMAQVQTFPRHANALSQLQCASLRRLSTVPLFRMADAWHPEGSDGGMSVVVVGEVGGQLEVPVGLGEQLGGLGL